MKLHELQQELGVTADGQWGPNTKRAFINAFVNKNASAIVHADYISAARRLGCTVAQIKAFAALESGGSSFSMAGRPKILFEAHYFSRLTKRRYDRSHPSISSRRWNRRLYARQMIGRYGRLAKAVRLDVNAGLSSMSIGKFQVMVAHWEHLGYDSAWDMCMKHVASEKNHLDCFIRFIEKNRLKAKLKACRPNDPQSCRAAVRAYNGPAYEKNRYHTKLAKMIARYS